MDIDGVPVLVNFVMAGDDRAPFLDPTPTTIDGVPVARQKYILDLKRRAGRPKDDLFFEMYPDLIAPQES